jgi:hypothetical protein
MIATIEKYGAGTCTWCRQASDDGVQAKFADGLAGYLCRKHFWEALKSRAGEQATREESRPIQKGSGQS